MNPLFDYDFMQEHEKLLGSFQNTSSDKQAVKAFTEIIKYYHSHKRRPFAWRDTIIPYHVVVSEIMLQQTQTDRVIQKFNDFITKFPTFNHLADADFADVLKVWKGLGYNRRAQALQKTAQRVVSDHHGYLPNDPLTLEDFPGIGPATARSIVAFAYNIPSVFIETNIRTVFIYFFFRNRTNVHDKELLPLIEQTVDHENAREWYYALMDYGVMLKKTVGNVSRNSAHYTKQSKFEGSDRQIRGMILELILKEPGINRNALFNQIDREQERIQKILIDLCNENFIKEHENKLYISTNVEQYSKKQ